MTASSTLDFSMSFVNFSTVPLNNVSWAAEMAQ